MTDQHFTVLIKLSILNQCKINQTSEKSIVYDQRVLYKATCDNDK